ncbi:putative ABC transporter permease [Butyrivibrio sp. AE3006]|uniref:putative ABC transporter permease n=1 Tax=Butyrivibrio sp. AE3006 TaxID=1280673 RepID=UPI000418F691|nr:putative ABC transporter permease [Butyrivibrio sp. AE3006]
MLISKLFIEFVMFSFIGWIYECTYCTVKEGHWSNRGFLFGPICPIYGTGTVLTLIIFGYVPVFSRVPVNEIPIWQIFLICSVGSIFLEYGTSYFLEKRFHAVWWDYNDMPLNINGRVCVPATLGFGVAGILVTRFVLPFSFRFCETVNPYVAEVIALLLMAYLAADLVLTVSSLYHLLTMVEKTMGGFDEKMEGAVQIAREKVNATAEMLDFRQKYQLKSIKNFRFKRPVLRSGKLINTKAMLEVFKALQEKIKAGK